MTDASQIDYEKNLEFRKYSKVLLLHKVGKAVKTAALLFGPGLITTILMPSDPHSLFIAGIVGALVAGAKHIVDDIRLKNNNGPGDAFEFALNGLPIVALCVTTNVISAFLIGPAAPALHNSIVSTAHSILSQAQSASGPVVLGITASVKAPLRNELKSPCPSIQPASSVQYLP
jgi:hypothetical protein